MNVTVERIADSQVRLEIAADQEEHSQAVDKAYRKLAREISVPGFRKGKAPRTMIERFFGREVFVEEANRELMDQLFRKAIEQESLIPIGDPEVDSIEPEPLSFVVTIPVYPTIEPGDYQSVRMEPVDASIEETAVDKLIEQIRVTESPWVDPAEPRKPRDGDQVTLDIQIMDGEEEFQPTNEDAIFVLGESNLLQELRAAIDSLAVGESTSANISFREDDDRYTEDDPRLGKTMTYNVTLKGIKERDLFELDDDFAKTYGNAESLTGLRERVYQNLHSERTREARTEVVTGIIDQLGELATFDIPKPMIEDAVNDRVKRLRGRLQYSGASLDAYLRQSNQTEAQLKEDIRPVAARELRSSMIMREIAEREGIEVNDSEVQSEIDGMTSMVPEREAMREAYTQNQYLRSVLRNDIFDQRLTDRLIEIATVGRGAVINGFVAPEPTAAGDEQEQPAGEPQAGPPDEASSDDEISTSETGSAP